MAENSKSLLIGMVLVGLFAFAMINFLINTGNLNTNPINIANNEKINSSFSEYESQITDFEEDTASQKDSFFKNLPVIGVAIEIVTAIVGVLKTFSNGIIGFFNITFGLMSSILGIPSSVIAAITGILLVLIIYLSHRTLKTGA